MEENNKALQKEIKELEKDIKLLKRSINQAFESMEKKLQRLQDLAWERESKKESSKMYKVLENKKPSTIVKSNVGDVVVDRKFMEKEIKKHLDNPALRGMVTTEEMLSYPKVARGVEAKFNPQQKGFDWRVKANDGSVLHYGERDYGEGHKLLTAHSKTERGERGHSHQQIYDPDFHNSAEGIVAQKAQLPQNDTKQTLTPEELQRRLDLNLRNLAKSSDESQRQNFLKRAESIAKEASKRSITLDSQSLHKLELAREAKHQTHSKENK